MKSIYSTVVLSAVLLASLSASPTEAWSSTTAVHQKIIHPNKNAMIIAVPHKVISTIPTRSTIPLSAATTNNNSFISSTMNSAASSTTLGVKAKHMISNLLRIRTILLHQFSTFTVLLTHKVKVVMLSTMLAITALFPPQCAVAQSNLFSLSSGAKDTSSSIVAPSSSNSSNSSGMKKVGKVVVTIGAVGAGASTANAMRGKFACSDDNEKEGGEDDEESAPVNGKKEKESPTTNGSSRQPTATTTKNNGAVNKNNKAEIEPLSEEWIQQQLNDAEKRSNVLNDAIKMTQQSSPPPASAVTKPSTKVNDSKKKMSVGNTIGIPSTNKSTPPPLVKNLDSKIQMLQQRNAERTKQQQRIHEEQVQVELEARQVAIVEAKQKIEAAEREYRKSQQQQQQQQEEEERVAVEEQEQQERVVMVVEEVDSTPTTTTTSSTLPAIKIGPGGTPAKSKEEDLELTTQVILEYVDSIDGKSGGVVDDDDE